MSSEVPAGAADQQMKGQGPALCSAEALLLRGGDQLRGLIASEAHDTPYVCDYVSTHCSVLCGKPVQLQTASKLQPRAVQPHPQISLGNAQILTYLCAI